MEGVVVNPSFWHGKRIFLTGHTGFKGSWLSLWLQQLGAKVTGYALSPPTYPSLFDLAQVENGMTSIIGDVRDGTALALAMQHAAPEIVIHMAAQPLVRLSYVDPVGTYSTNMMGTVHLLEAVRKTKSIRAVLNVTSDKCYENTGKKEGYREDEAMGGFDPYSSSKACSELITAAYRDSFFNPAQYDHHQVALASARAGNVIGGGDWAKDRLVPDIVAAFENKQTVEIRNPHATRPWQHVLEPLRGYLTLVEKLYMQGNIFAEAWNFGPYSDDVQPVEWIAQQLAQKWADGTSWKIDSRSHPHEASYLKLDISKANNLLGWRPVLRLDQALDLIVEWAREKQRGADLRMLTQTQIMDYQATVMASNCN
ncbi:MAG: CDP-glucose 4,6-dehydratase [Pseudomonadota bacterium]